MSDHLDRLHEEFDKFVEAVECGMDGMRERLECLEAACDESEANAWEDGRSDGLAENTKVNDAQDRFTEAITSAWVRCHPRATSNGWMCTTEEPWNSLEEALRR